MSFTPDRFYLLILFIKPEMAKSGTSALILALGGLRYEDHEFEGSLAYMVRYCYQEKQQQMPPPIIASKKI